MYPQVGDPTGQELGRFGDLAAKTVLAPRDFGIGILYVCESLHFSLENVSILNLLIG